MIKRELKDGINEDLKQQLLQNEAESPTAETEKRRTKNDKTSFAKREKEKEKTKLLRVAR
ncbi:hypothetical protein ACEQPO_18140 [Bacillus sp. SL00103]